MYLTGMLLVLLMTGIISYILFKKYDKPNSWVDVCIGSFIIFAAALIFGGGSTMFDLHAQIEAPYKFEQLRDQEKIYSNKADAIIGELKIYLANMYPNHEKEIFESISPGNAGEVMDLYLVKYPELKASETFMSLSQSIQELRSKIYDVQLARAQLKKEVRFRPHAPWILSWMMPEVDVGE